METNHHTRTDLRDTTIWTIDLPAGRAILVATAQGEDVVVHPDGTHEVIDPPKDISILGMDALNYVADHT